MGVFMRELQNFDVLLYKYCNTLGRIISSFDGTDYCHCSLYYNGKIVEVLANGIKESNIESIFKRQIDVFRHNDINKNKTRLESSVNKYINSKASFAYEQMAILVVLTFIRKFQSRRLSDKLANGLENILEEIKNDTVEALICSEFIYRCFRESGCEVYIRDLNFDKHSIRNLQSIMQIDKENVEADFITPGDLSKSKSFIKLGEIKIENGEPGIV